MLGVSTTDIISILQLGMSGVAFLFLFMSFSLLKKEQNRSEGVRENFLRSTKHFSYISIVFAVLVMIAGFVDLFFSQSTINDACLSAIERAELLSESEQQDIDSLRDLLRNTLAPCRQ